MPSSAEAKLYRALKSRESTIRSIVDSLSPDEAEEWNRIFQEHPIAGVPLGQYGLRALMPLAGFAGRKVSGELLKEVADHIANEIASELAFEFGIWLADAHFPGAGIAARLAFMTYKVNQVRSIFYNRSFTDEVINRVADATGVRKRVEDTINNAIADEIRRRFDNGDDGMFGGLVPIRRR